MDGDSLVLDTKNYIIICYMNMVQNYMLGKNIGYFAKEVNSANVPKARPIEDIWENLKAKGYEGDWKAKNLELKKYGPKGCTRSCEDCSF
ncbi:hypothetical protein BpHYR1_042657 [Brachionus plicatilis]|uniref:Uncharacterized protein n=1 Tax=Brachionus plicatilis TaxID=10195 RepID=A0A3M7QA98_BRAPC|nr:hypothetical protein BpHYR1_042657 [Brachionus plicatilis]